MDLAVIAIVFGAIFVVELPDKTFIAALVLSTRYKPLAVWVGVGPRLLRPDPDRGAGRPPGDVPARRADQVGGAGDLPGRRRGAVSGRPRAPTRRRRSRRRSTPPRRSSPAPACEAVGASFLVLFAAEWGDLSQLLTISMIAKYGHPVERLHRRLGRAADRLRPRRARRAGAAALREAVGDPLHRRRGVPACSRPSRPWSCCADAGRLRDRPTAAAPRLRSHERRMPSTRAAP